MVINDLAVDNTQRALARTELALIARVVDARALLQTGRKVGTGNHIAGNEAILQRQNA
jgi:hypothetical protein